MNAYVAVTDADWYGFLSRQEDLDEVNFWQPKPWGGELGVLHRGEPLLFKLKAPHNAIAGVGFFERYVTLPFSLAWDAFGVKNGAADRHAMWERIARLRHDRPEWWEDFQIGCLMLVEPCFFPPERWIPQPASFSPNIVRGKGYDLTEAEGQAMWDQVVAAMGASCGPRPGSDTEVEQPSLFGGYGDPALVRRRLGQGTFQVLVTEAYRRSCAITGERALPALEAAHIRPFSELETHTVQNGLLLRSDVHRLFDRGYITVTPEHRVEASSRMREDFNDGEAYLRLHGRAISVPDRDDERPAPEFLRWHNEERYRG
jgi:putative restriction endonuclease